MDRISALRNVEDALAAFEEGETDFEGLETRVRGVLRTYATEFEGELAAYRVTGDGDAAGMVVMATGEQAARERVRELVDGTIEVSVERVTRTAEAGSGPE